MRDPQELRSLARNCRELAKASIDRGAIEQLRIWAAELADEADQIERDLESASAASEVVSLKRA